MIDWAEIDTVLLDMDGTLLDLAFDNYFWLEYLPQRYAEHHGLPLDEALELLQGHSRDAWGSLNWYCLDHWSRTLDIDVRALKHQVRDHITVRPHTPAFLAFLRRRNKAVMLVTNAHPATLSLKVAASGLHQHVDRMISSHELHLAKENAGFWDRLRAREGIDLGRSVLLDDSPPVLRRARAEGVGQAIQMLQPDSRRSPLAPEEFPGIVHFTELMPQP